MSSIPEQDEPTPARRAADWQAAYYVLTGIWPLLARRSLEAVTGRKRDSWLVQTVGGLVAVTGAALATASRERTLQSPASGRCCSCWASTPR